MNATKTPRHYVSIVFAALFVLMLALGGTANAKAQQLPPLPMPLGGSIDPQLLQSIMQQRNAMLENQAQAKIQEVQQHNALIQQINEQINAWRALNPGAAPTPEIQSLIDQLNALSSQSQMDMLQLQSMMNQQNQATDLISNLLKQQAELKNSIIGNLR